MYHEVYMHKIIFFAVLMITTTGFTCSCVPGFNEIFEKRKVSLVSEALDVSENMIQDIKTLKMETGNSLIEKIALKIVKDECERSCLSVPSRGRATLLVSYLNQKSENCLSELELKARVSNKAYDELKKVKVKVISNVCN